MYVARWLLWTFFFSFLFPALLSLFDCFTGTGSFFDEMGTNYLVIILSQAMSSLWTIINFQNFKSQETKSLICTLIVLPIILLYTSCITFFTPLAGSIIPQYENIVYECRKLILIVSPFIYLPIMFLTAYFEWKSYILTLRAGILYHYTINVLE